MMESTGFLEENLRIKISFNLFGGNSNKWFNKREINLKEYNRYYSNHIKLSGLDINTINELAEKIATPIYYLFSCVRDYVSNKTYPELPFKKISFSRDYFHDYNKLKFLIKNLFLR